MKEMGTIEFHRITDLFDSESEFTAWLADHLDELGKQVGLDIERISVEEPVGSFRCDIYGRERRTNRKVVIENQLYRSDHSHLGQLLTYASGLDGGVIIWITPEFSEEHRGALDWLNEHTSEDVWFFGVRARAVKIGDSPLAPLFEVVARPNVPFKEAKGTVAVTERGQFYIEFWSEVIARLNSSGIHRTKQKPPPENWIGLSSGRSGLWYSLTFRRGNRFGVELDIDTGDKEKNEDFFDSLLARQIQVEGSFGGDLVWERYEEGQYCYIGAYRSYLDCRAEKAELLEWGLETFKRLKGTFDPLIRELQ
ncbi:MAG: hypothetical protein B1H03_02715 [Planctomycetales bacterium 4484_113]|nr:MAG: hypothetical protein B1H03_02715 [Planctomycetales bacterium 4484_113]